MTMMMIMGVMREDIRKQETRTMSDLETGTRGKTLKHLREGSMIAHYQKETNDQEILEARTMNG